MKVPLRIYYDITNGQVIQITGNFEDNWLNKYDTVEEQIPKYTALNERVRESFDVIELPFGQYRNEFTTATSYRVNPTTKEIEFDYDPLFNLEEYKSFKIEELRTKCNEDIYNGFTSTLNNHHYRTNNEDQLNFLGKFNQLMTDETILTVMWKTEDVGYLEHTRADWLTVYNEALAAKEQKLFKYDQVKQQVNACTTKEEVEAVTW